MSLRAFWQIILQAGEAWLDDRAPRIGAALAFYTALSLSPLLVIVLAIAGLIYGEEAARGGVAHQISGMVGDQLAITIEEMIANSKKPKTSIIAIVIGVITLIVGATGVFGELQDAINDVWKVRRKRGRPVWTFVRARFLSFGMVLGVGFLLTVSLALTAGLEAVRVYMTGLLPGAAVVLHVVNFAITFLIEGFLFGMIFRVLPDARLAWRDVAFGAFLTAAMFNLGKYLIVLYLGFSSVGSAFGAAGSVVALLVWIYYSTQILMFGAEVTKVVAERSGRRIAPAKGAEAIPGADTPVIQTVKEKVIPDG